MPPKAAAAEKKPAAKAPAQKAPAEKKDAGKKTAATGDKKKRKTRKETYSSYIYKGSNQFYRVGLCACRIYECSSLHLEDASSSNHLFLLTSN